MIVPYRSQYRSPLRRIAAVRVASLSRRLRRPLVQLALSAALIVAATAWLHQHTPARLGQDGAVLRAGVVLAPAFQQQG